MAVKVEMLIQVCVNGRPVWRKARAMKNEMSFLMTDREYDSVLNSAVRELTEQVKIVRGRQEKDKVSA